MASKTFIAEINASGKPNTLLVKENGRRLIVKDVVRIEEGFVSYPGSMYGNIVRKDYRFEYADGTWNRYRDPVISYYNPEN